MPPSSAAATPDAPDGRRRGRGAPARRLHVLLPDPGGEGVLLLTGPPEQAVDDGPMSLWRWDGDAWSVVDAPGPAPSAAQLLRRGATTRTAASIVLFGGDTAAGASAETWEWDGAAWTAFEGAGPGARCRPSLAFDPASGTSVLYGGNERGGRRPGRDLGLGRLDLDPAGRARPGADPLAGCDGRRHRPRLGGPLRRSPGRRREPAGGARRHLGVERAVLDAARRRRPDRARSSTPRPSPIPSSASCWSAGPTSSGRRATCGTGTATSG